MIKAITVDSTGLLNKTSFAVHVSADISTGKLRVQGGEIMPDCRLM